MRMTISSLSADQRAELESDLREDVLSWRQLVDKGKPPNPRCATGAAAMASHAVYLRSSAHLASH